MNTVHQFRNINGAWKVICDLTKGNFYTTLWKKEIIPRQQCPCCKMTVTRP